MSNVIKASPVAFLIPQMQQHYRKGNVVEIVLRTKLSADKDFGIGGTVTENVTLLSPEPSVNPLRGEAVIKSGGAYRFSDLKMTVARDSISDEIGLDMHTEFNVNGVRYQILATTPGPTAREFIIRRKGSEPVTP